MSDIYDRMAHGIFIVYVILPIVVGIIYSSAPRLAAAEWSYTLSNNTYTLIHNPALSLIIYRKTLRSDEKKSLEFGTLRSH